MPSSESFFWKLRKYHKEIKLKGPYRFEHGLTANNQVIMIIKDDSDTCIAAIDVNDALTIPGSGPVKEFLENKIFEIECREAIQEFLDAQK